MPRRRRVVVTGLGSVTAAGTGAEKFWRWITDGPDGAVAGNVEGFDPLNWMDKRDLARTAEFSRYALAGSTMAMEDAGSPACDPTRCGVVLSTVYAAHPEIAEQTEMFQRHGESSVSLLLGPVAAENAAASAVSMRFGFRGPSKTVIGACAGGSFAIGDAADLIMLDRAELVLAGGSQGPITPTMLASYTNLRVISHSGLVRPFDIRRDGFVFGSGSAILVLEELEHAQRRDARIYAELLASANTNDGAFLFRPTGTGAVECMTRAIQDAGVSPADIAHVNAHGTGTIVNDNAEASAILEVFAEVGAPPVTSIKRITGHLAGASAAIEALASVLSIHHRHIPTSGHEASIEERLGIDVVIGSGRSWEPGLVLSNSFGLGGHNGCLIFGPPPE